MYALLDSNGDALQMRDNDVSSQVISLVSSEGIWVVPRAKKEEAAAAHMKFHSKEGDHITLLSVMRAYDDQPMKQRIAWCHDNFINHRYV
jgi:hypothetical protein